MPTPADNQRERVHCPTCRNRVLVSRPTRGNQVDCPRCGSPIWLTPLKADTDLIILVDGLVIETTSFTKESWTTGSLRERGTLAADLISTRRLMGLPRREVLALLGRTGGSTAEGIGYGVDLGRRDDFRGRPYRLRIDFNAEDRVSAVELEKHELR